MQFKKLPCIALLATLAIMPAAASTKLVALPERQGTTINLNNSQATLIEEERTIIIQKGTNQIDFSWAGVDINTDSLFLTIIKAPGNVKISRITYPPDSSSIVWELTAADSGSLQLRISYLLNNIDSLTAYRADVAPEENSIRLQEYLVLRNFSGEDFPKADIVTSSRKIPAQCLAHAETKQLSVLNKEDIPIVKVWKFDAAVQPWDMEKAGTGLPFSYRLVNNTSSSLGTSPLSEGKIRIYQTLADKGQIFLGEDNIATTPPGEKVDIQLGESRDLIVVQRKMLDLKINVRRNNRGEEVLYDTNEKITAKIQNCKDQPTILTVVEHIDGQWDMEKCNYDYTRDDANTITLEIPLPANSTKELTMHYHRRNLR